MLKTLSRESGIRSRRLKILLCGFALLSLFLLFTLFRLQVVGYEDYQKKVLEQITVGSSLAADRGIIYDSGGTVLAENKTVYRIYISPVDISKKSKRKNVSYSDIVAKGLSELLDVSYDAVYEKAQKSAYLDQTVKRNVDEELAKKVLSFAQSNGLSSMIHVEAGSKRYYPLSSLASHTIGFTGSDNQGLFGLEAYYNDILSGEDGKYMTAVDSRGIRLPLSYSDFLSPKNGYSITTTLDVYIQSALEHELEEALIASDVKNRTTGIVMNVKTGGILAMATAPSFDLNNPYALDEASLKKLTESGYESTSKEYRSLKNELLYSMWRNKAVSELYEPGSTFKIITCSIALESKAVTSGTSFFCPGYYTVGGRRISCHKHGGHGSLTFAEGLMQSCNPVMMQSAERVGKDAFYRYYLAFGYGGKTGIDLPSEASGIFHSYDSLGSTELATASFGQRFKVSVISQLTAIAAVANGGVAVTPHLLSSITDENGKTVFTYAQKEGERIISEETAKLVSSILEEGVSGNGGSKNAYAEGYHVAAKTGTSEKFDILDAGGRSFLRIGSCVAFAPYDDAEIAVIFIVDEPNSYNKYGSVTAAPYVSSLLETILPYLGYEKEKSGESVMIPDVLGLSPSKAKSILYALGVSVEVLGDGATVLAQTPLKGTLIQKQDGRVILYTTEKTEYSAVPNTVGKTVFEASRLLTDAGFNLKISGALGDKTGEGATVVSQSLPPGTRALIGSVVEIRVLHKDDSE